MAKTLKWQVAQRLEKRWWQSYLSNKQPLEYLIWKKQYWKNFLGCFQHLVDIKPTDSIADIGCGPAGIFTLFESNEVTAVDPLLNHYQNELSIFNKSEYSNVRFVSSSFEDFHPTEQFNFVFCLNAINHFSNLELSFKKLNNITELSGYCVLSIDAHNHEFLKFLFRAIPGDALHPHQYNLEEYKTLFERVGFEIEDVSLKKSQSVFNYYTLIGKKTSELPHH